MERPVLVHRVIARLNVGGPALHVVNLAEGLDRRGSFETCLMAGRVTGDEGDMGYYARERGVAVQTLPALSRVVSPLDDLRILWFLFRRFREERPRIVHTHTAKAGTLGRLAAFLAGVPVRIHTFHGHVLGGGYFSPLVTRFYLGVERQLARLSSRLVVLSEAQKEEMARDLGVAEESRFAVIPLGLELGPFAEVDREDARGRVRGALGISPEEVVVGIVGRMVPVKNHELLLRAHVLMEERLGRPVRILMVGSGLLEEALRRRVGAMGTEARVSWLGWRRDLPDLYPAMDVLALTSLDEGTPVAVLEALAAGTVVAARPVGGIPEILEGVPLACLIPEGTPESVAEAVAGMATLEVSEEVRRSVREGIRERFSTERLVSEMEALYREELAKVG